MAVPHHLAISPGLPSFGNPFSEELVFKVDVRIFLRSFSLLFTQKSHLVNRIRQSFCSCVNYFYSATLSVWFGLERYGLFFATRGLIRPGPPS